MRSPGSAVSVDDSGAGVLHGRRASAGDESADARARGRAEQTIRGLVHITARERSTVVDELALRPGFSAQARMPPTALLAPRGVRRGLLVLTAGPVRYFYGRYPTGPVAAAKQNWWASGLRYRRSCNRASAGLHADNGTLRRPHQMRPQLGDSAGRRSATNREQRCVALGAVALPAGTTVGQGHLPRVGDGDLLAADASALWLGLRCLWLSCARFNHGPGSIFPADWLSRGRCQSTRADLRSEHPLARLVGGLGLVRGIVGQLS